MDPKATLALCLSCFEDCESAAWDLVHWLNKGGAMPPELSTHTKSRTLFLQILVAAGIPIPNRLKY